MIKKLFLVSLLNFVCIVGVIFVYGVFGTKTVDKPTEPSQVQITLTPETNLAVTLTQKLTPTRPIVSPTTSTPTIVTTPTIDPLAGKCLVYIDETRYDVSDFRNLHDGGDIFQCGTDMSNIFHGQHPVSMLSKMSKYKI